jgi:hypothetical protein
MSAGTVEKEAGEPHAREITYFSQLCDAKTFQRAAALPHYRAATEKVEVVCAVLDGADWL